VDDATIRATIARRYQAHGEIFCPHTATAVHVLETLRAAGEGGDWAVAATAHPAKFESIVEPLVGAAVDVPPALSQLLARPAQAEPLAADYAALRQRVLALS
jgi:threonine synthase